MVGGQRPPAWTGGPLRGRGWPLFGASHMCGPDGTNFYARTEVATGRWPESGRNQVERAVPQTR